MFAKLLVTPSAALPCYYLCTSPTWNLGGLFYQKGADGKFQGFKEYSEDCWLILSETSWNLQGIYCHPALLLHILYCVTH